MVLKRKLLWSIWYKVMVTLMLRNITGLKDTCFSRKNLSIIRKEMEKEKNSIPPCHSSSKAMCHSLSLSLLQLIFIIFYGNVSVTNPQPKTI